MKIIMHRRNTIDELESTPRQYGVEIDLRTWRDELIVQHDPFLPGESFARWVTSYRHGTLILNVKEEGLEERLMAVMKEHAIEDYFFLDQSFPFLVRWAGPSGGRCAVRVSEFESVDTALNLAGKIGWVWVDCFTHFALTAADAARLKQAGYKICLVSPELQGRAAEAEIPQLAKILRSQSIQADAVCTKRPDLWELEAARA